MNKKNTKYVRYDIYESSEYERLRYPNNPERDELETVASESLMEQLYIKYENGKAADIVVEDNDILTPFRENSKYIERKNIIGKTCEDVEKQLKADLEKNSDFDENDDFIEMSYISEPSSPNEFTRVKIAFMMEKGNYKGMEKTFEREENESRNRDALADKAKKLDMAVKSAQWKKGEEDLSPDEIARARFRAYKDMQK